MIEYSDYTLGEITLPFFENKVTFHYIKRFSNHTIKHIG